MTQTRYNVDVNDPSRAKKLLNTAPVLILTSDRENLMDQLKSISEVNVQLNDLGGQSKAS